MLNRQLLAGRRHVWVRNS